MNAPMIAPVSIHHSLACDNLSLNRCAVGVPEFGRIAPNGS
jgi:hypothetical protein